MNIPLNHIFSCSSCECTYEPSPNTLSCRSCEAPLNVIYYEELSHSACPAGWTGPDIPLPVVQQSDYITLGEGNTPIVKLKNSNGVLPENVYAKLEYQNPTGSFKDRGTAIMLSVLNTMGVTELVEDSSGNAGASISAYSANSNIRAHIFAPETTPLSKMIQIQIYGAETYSIPGTREDATFAAREFAKKFSHIYASHNLSPYFIEGTKIFAYELFDQLANEMPDDIIMPVGNGSLYLGMWKGINELHEKGLITKIPRLHCVQARAVMPIVAAHNGEFWDKAKLGLTKAGGIAVGSPPRLHQVLDVLKKSNGSSIAVDEDEITLWHTRLPKSEGIYAEPTSAAAFAGAQKLLEMGVIESASRVLIPVTGFGMKDKDPS